MPVRMWWQIFQTWINYLIQGFSLQLKIDRLKYLSWWLYFSSRREPSVLKTGRIGDFRRCYIVLCWDFLRKEKGKYTVTLINRRYLILLLVLRTVFAVGFWLLSLLQLKLWARIPLQIGQSPSAVLPYLCVSFHKCVSVSF